EPPLTYRAPWCQAKPATNCGEFGIGVAVPPLSTNTPPFGGAVFDSTPPSPSNTFPPPKANDVGVWRPLANRVTLAPPTPVGRGGGPLAALATLAATPVATTDAASNAALRTRMTLLSLL